MYTIKCNLVQSLFADITGVAVVFSLVKSRQVTVATSLVLQFQVGGVAGGPACSSTVSFLHRIFPQWNFHTFFQK